MPRGGRRPGAGAPKGNINALKYGRQSKQLKSVLAALVNMPELRHYLLEVQKRQARQSRRAEHLYRKALLQFLSRTPSIKNPLVTYLVYTSYAQITQDLKTGALARLGQQLRLAQAESGGPMHSEPVAANNQSPVARNQAMT